MDNKEDYCLKQYIISKIFTYHIGAYYCMAQTCMYIITSIKTAKQMVVINIYYTTIWL